MTLPGLPMDNTADLDAMIPPTPATDMAATELTFRVGLALGRSLEAAKIVPLPQMPANGIVQYWSSPDHLGYRYLMTFRLVETP